MATIPEALAIALHYHQIGNLPLAETIYQRILEIDPDHFSALHHYGVVALQQGQPRLAVERIRRAIALVDNNADAHANLGVAYQSLGNLDEAICCFRQSLRIQPSSATTHYNLANAYRDQGNLDEAVENYQKTLLLKPDFAEAHNNRGKALTEQGNLIGAIASFRAAVRHKPDFSYAHSNLLFCLTHDPDTDPQEVFAEHCRWGEIHGKVATSPLPHANLPDPERRLRIGYVSPDFRQHPVARQFEPILAHHDPNKVETVCYAEVRAGDAVTNRLRNLAHLWRSTHGLPDAPMADLIRADGIDILVDLAGHTARHRLKVFARKPAPVQATYLGYPGTTGLKTIDYRLTDAVLDPPGDPIRDTEKLVRLPQGGCFITLENAPAVTPLPARQSGWITFGSLHRLSKINPYVVVLWSRILAAIPSSRLIVFPRSLSLKVKEALLRQFTEQGIRGERLDFRDKKEPRGHLAVYEEIDVTLDTFPYGGGTTLCESLWMGVPVLTLRGTRPAGRGGAAILTLARLTEWIAETPEETVRLAVEHTRDLDRLAELRAGLRGRMRETLCDGATFTRHLEEAYRSMWQKWCARQH